MESTNKDKARAGLNTEKELVDLLNKLANKYDTIALKKPVEYGEKGKDNKQFKANAQIKFIEEDIVWLIVVSSSFRSDRIKSKEFDIEHIKNILIEKEIHPEAYFILPDNAKAKDVTELQKFKKHIDKQDRVTYFDGAMLMHAFSNMLEQKLTENIKQGQRSNILGNSGEEKLKLAFNNQNNLKIWNDTKDCITKSANYSLFKSVLNGLAPSIGKICHSVAYGSSKHEESRISQDLKQVRSPDNRLHGKPKTDILISIINEKGDNIILKASVKQPASSKNKVTVHEGSVEQLLTDLKSSLPKNSKFNNSDLFNSLSIALLDFQAKGSKKTMLEENLHFLNENLADLNKWLIDYFIFGINNSYLNKNQQANALIVFNPNTGGCIARNILKEESKLLNGKKATFGTPFSWTYPSKKRGKKIQIKSPID